MPDTVDPRVLEGAAQLRKLAFPVEARITGGGMYHVKKAFEELGWQATWFWYRRGEPLTMLLWCIGVTDDERAIAIVRDELKRPGSADRRGYSPEEDAGG